MKGVLLHGGHGTRLRSLTHNGPKQLIRQRILVLDVGKRIGSSIFVVEQDS